MKYIRQTFRIEVKDPETKAWSWQDVTCDCTLDLDAVLTDLARRAVRSKSKRATLDSGRIKVKFVSKKPVA